jgi:hypothetical protein
MGRKPKGKRKKEISAAVLHALRYAAQFNPPTAAVPFPPPTGAQIDLFLKMTDGERREYFKVAMQLLEGQRRRERYANRNKENPAAQVG